MHKYLMIGLAVGFGLLTTLPQEDCMGQRNNRRGRSQRSRGGDEKAPKIGDKAPDFKLKSLDGKSETQLSSFKGKKPVVLFFGSYT